MISHKTYSADQIYSVYQPVISLRKGRTIFEEALGRGKGPEGQPLSPLPMLAEAKERGTLAALDFAFFTAALEGWSERKQHSILSVNIDASCIDSQTLPKLLGAMEGFGILPNRIILEICENQCANPQELSEFVKLAKNSRFLIAIDDLGKEHSNLDRIIFFAPDIIKLDRELIQDIQFHKNKQALVRSMVRFSVDCGAQVVAEGVEQWEEVFSLMEQGIDLFQGYFFAKPAPHPTPKSVWAEKYKVLGRSFRAHRMNSQRRTKEFRHLLTELCTRACSSLRQRTTGHFNRVLSKYVSGIPQIECLYLLDGWGEQVSRTFFSSDIKSNRTPLFAPASPGEDHSLKDYFLNLPADGVYLSETYISQATGNPCRTFSHWFRDNDGCAYILCVDIPEEVMQIALT